MSVNRTDLEPAPRVVLLPDLGDAPSSWDSVPFERVFDVLVVDTTTLAKSAGAVDAGSVGGHPAATLTLAEWAVPVLDGVLGEFADTDDLVLVGHGWGAQVAVAFAGHRTVAAVVIVDEVLDFAGLQESGADVLRERLPSVIGGIDADIVDRVTSDRVQEPLVRERAYAVISRASLDAAEESADRLCTKANSTKVLAIHGVDPGDQYSFWLRLRIPNAEVERWPLGGHYPHLAEPALFVRRLSHLLSSIHP